MITLTLPYPPSVNRIWRNVGPRTLLSSEGRAYKDAAALVLAAQRITPYTCPVVLTVWVYRPRKSGDLSNRLKLIEDCLQGPRGAFLDDSQIVELHAHRYDDKKRPRVEVAVWPAPQTQETHP